MGGIMKLLHETDIRFRALPWKLATFALTAALSAILTLLYVAYKQGYFEDKTPIYFISDSGNDLQVGMAVRFSGFKIGEVRDLSLDARGRVRILTQIESRHLKWLKPDSIGRVGKEGVIGNAYIDVGLGDPRRLAVKAGAELEFVPARSFDEVVREVRDRAVPVFEEVELLIKRVNDPEGDLQQTLANLRVLSSELQTTRRKLDQGLDQLQGLAAKDVPQTLGRVQRTLQEADTALQMVQAQLPSIMRKADQSLENLQNLSATANQTLDAAAPEAIGLIQDGRALVGKGVRTLDKADQLWPLNQLSNPSPRRAPPSDSQGSGQ